MSQREDAAAAAAGGTTRSLIGKPFNIIRQLGECGITGRAGWPAPAVAETTRHRGRPHHAAGFRENGYCESLDGARTEGPLGRGRLTLARRTQGGWKESLFFLFSDACLNIELRTNRISIFERLRSTMQFRETKTKDGEVLGISYSWASRMYTSEALRDLGRKYGIDSERIRPFIDTNMTDNENEFLNDICHIFSVKRRLCSFLSDEVEAYTRARYGTHEGDAIVKHLKAERLLEEGAYIEGGDTELEVLIPTEKLLNNRRAHLAPSDPTD